MKLLNVLLLSALGLLASCTHLSHSSRTAYVPENDLTPTPSIADLDVDFSKKLSATSDLCDSAKLAKENAMYKALTESDASVLIDPVFKIENRNGAYVATVTGFSGNYTSSRTVPQAMQELSGISSEAINHYQRIYGEKKAEALAPRASRLTAPKVAPPAIVSGAPDVKTKPLSTSAGRSVSRNPFYLKVSGGAGDVDCVPEGDEWWTSFSGVPKTGELNGTAETAEYTLGMNVSESFSIEASRYTMNTELSGQWEGNPVNIDLSWEGYVVNLNYNILPASSKFALIPGISLGQGNITLGNIGLPGEKEEDEKLIWRVSVCLEYRITDHISISAGYQYADFDGGENNLTSSSLGGFEVGQDYLTTATLYSFGLAYRF